MLATPAPILRTNPAAQIIIALVLSLVAVAPVLALPIPFLPIVIGILPFLLIFAFRNAFILCLGFVIFSFFRIHEAFPVLNPLHIPQLLAVGTLAVLSYHLFLSKSIQGYWATELTTFAVFFTLVTIGVFFAANRPTAIAYWNATYVKIAIMTLAIAWLTRVPKDFALAARAFVMAGMAIAGVTIFNKLSGIGLVEGTRVTVARDIKSVLGDPNDLSLVLLFPLSFAASLVAKRTGFWSAAMGVIACVMIVWAIIATQSRGGLLGLMVVFGIVGSRMIKSKAVLFSIGGLAVLVLFAAAGISGRSSGGAGESGIDESSMGRIYAWGAAWKMALTRPLNGVGLDNFVANYYFYSDHWDGMNHAVHSTWFGVLGETGFPGLITFVTMIVLMVRVSIKTMLTLDRLNAHMSARAMALAVVAGIPAFCISGTFLTQGFTWPIYILLSQAVAVSRFAKVESEAAQNAMLAPPKLPN
jgi:putative inorganic carbon (hco3(-)) transporter